MLCRDVEEQEIAAKYVARWLDPAIEEEFEAHLVECGQCQTLLEALLALREELEAQKISALPAFVHEQSNAAARTVRSCAAAFRGPLSSSALDFHLRWAGAAATIAFTLALGFWGVSHLVKHNPNFYAVHSLAATKRPKGATPSATGLASTLNTGGIATPSAVRAPKHQKKNSQIASANRRDHLNFVLKDSHVSFEPAPSSGPASSSGVRTGTEHARSKPIKMDGADRTDNFVASAQPTSSHNSPNLASNTENNYPRGSATATSTAQADSFGLPNAASGDLRIVVKDPHGNPVAGATVMAQDQAKVIEREASGNGLGKYTFQALPPATYTVTVKAQGFATATAPDIAITVGGSAELPVTLTIASNAETVEVSADVELIETTKTSSTDTVNERSIDDLPINGRNYINMTGQRARSNVVSVETIRNAKELCRLGAIRPPAYTFAGSKRASNTNSDRGTLPVTPSSGPNQPPAAGRTAFKSGMDAYVEKRYEDAVVLLQAAMKEEPRAVDTNFYLGISLLMRGKPKESVGPLQTAANEKSPYAQSAHFFLAKAYLQTADFARAENELQIAASMPGRRASEASSLLARVHALRSAENNSPRAQSKPN